MKQILLIVVLACMSTGVFGQQKTDYSRMQARKSPEWITNGIIYQMQARAFTTQGTLQAATEKLPHVAETGATIVYLCPVFVADDDTDTTTWSARQKASKMNNPRNPYRMMDYYHVDPEYGSDDDLKVFVKKAHDLGMQVMLDMVYFHSGANAVFLKGHPDYIQRDKDGNPILGSWNWPALNFESSGLRDYLIKNMEYWVKEFNVDGFRLDVAGPIPLDFWEQARDRLDKIRPDVGLLAEATESGRPGDQIKAFDLNYSFIYYSNLKKVYSGDSPASTLRTIWEETESKVPKGARFIRYFDNHDISNDDYYNRREQRWGFAGSNAALVHIFTLDGVPFIYNGQEIADRARHSIFGKAPIDWPNAETLAGQLRLDFVKKLSEMRKTEKALTQGELKWLDNDQPESVVSYVRTLNGEQILTVINLSNHPVKVNIQGTSGSPSEILLSDIISGDPKEGFEMEAYGYWVGKL
jgi:cyclomaltodextrinase